MWKEWEMFESMCCKYRKWRNQLFGTIPAYGPTVREAQSNLSKTFQGFLFQGVNHPPNRFALASRAWGRLNLSYDENMQTCKNVDRRRKMSLREKARGSVEGIGIEVLGKDCQCNKNLGKWRKLFEIEMKIIGVKKIIKPC